MQGVGEFGVIDVIKVGKVVIHVLDKELPEEEEVKTDGSSLKGVKVRGSLNMARRAQLQAHHTGTHLVFAACRRVLGPHVWQAGAKKTVDKAHLDITHYRSLSKEEEIEIENMANRLIMECHEIKKGFMDKAEAELQYGFSLYQGGVVPGNSLRVVNIADVDTEACCGTHADNTAEVGWVRLIRSSRISDGIVRLEYCAQEKAIELLNKETNILNQLCEDWGVDQGQILPTGTRFFNEYKRLKALTSTQDNKILTLEVKNCINSPEGTLQFIRSDQPDPTLYVSSLKQFADQLQAKKNGIIYIGKTFVVGLLASPEMIDLKKLEATCAQLSSKQPKCNSMNNVTWKFADKKKKPLVTKGILQFMITGADYNLDKLAEDLTHAGA